MAVGGAPRGFGDSVLLPEARTGQARVRPPCSSGCEEMAREVFFSRDSILWWAITQHLRVKRRWERRVGAGEDVRDGGKVRRIGGWGDELRKWKSEVEEMKKGE